MVGEVIVASSMRETLCWRRCPTLLNITEGSGPRTMKGLSLWKGLFPEEPWCLPAILCLESGAIKDFAACSFIFVCLFLLGHRPRVFPPTYWSEINLARRIECSNSCERTLHGLTSLHQSFDFFYFFFVCVCVCLCSNVLFFRFGFCFFVFLLGGGNGAANICGGGDFWG